MTDIVTAIYELMGRHPDTTGPDTEKIKDKVETIFQVSFFSICTPLREKYIYSIANIYYLYFPK